MAGYRYLNRCVLIVLPLLLAACGVGDVEEYATAYGPVGVDGATILAGDVRLEIPAGALDGPTAIGIIPQTLDLQIQPPPGDGSTYEVVSQVWCCGPRGLTFLVDGRLIVAYQDASRTYPASILPPGASEADLVLLLWDEALGALVPATGATHDLAANTFTVDGYRTLGYLALGLRTSQIPSLVLRAYDTTQQAVGLYLASTEGTEPPQLLPGGAPSLTTFAPSPDGTRVLFELSNYATSQVEAQSGQNGYGPDLWTVGYGDAAAVELVGAGDHAVSGSDPVLGWLRSGNRVFFEATDDTGGDDDGWTYLGEVPGDGGAGPSELYGLDWYAYTNDIRQSPDGTLVLVRYYAGEEYEQIDIFRAATGEAESQAVIPSGGGHATPRFLPDSSGVYLISDDRDEVVAYDPDGSNERTLLTVASSAGTLKDFVFAPNGDDYAYIVRTIDVQQVGTDVLYVGSLSEGVSDTLDLQQDEWYDELIFHPSGEHVLFDSWYGSVRMLAFDGLTPAGIDQEVDAFDDLDIHAATGDILIVSFAQAVVAGSSQVQQVAGAGIWIAGPDGSDATMMDLPSNLQVSAARWTRTIRTAPCMGYVNTIR